MADPKETVTRQLHVDKSKSFIKYKGVDQNTLISVHNDFVKITIPAFSSPAEVIKCVVSTLELLHKPVLWPFLNLGPKKKETGMIFIPYYGFLLHPHNNTVKL